NGAPVAQLHRRTRLRVKTTSPRLAGHQTPVQGLARDRTVHPPVPRTIHLTHAAGAERFLNQILLVERPAYKRVRRRQCPCVFHFISEVLLGSFAPLGGLSRRWWPSIGHAPPTRLLHSSPLRSQSANDFRMRREQKMRTMDER